MNSRKSPRRRNSPLRPPLRTRRTTQPPSKTQPDAGTPGGDRLQKALAQAGLGSRRHLEALISKGRVQVNGRPAILGQRVSAGDRISVDGRAVRFAAASRGAGAPRLLLYHKPAGEIVSRDDPRGRPTVFDRLPEVADARWVAVGRLDFNTSGLLLFTDSGELAHRLMHPSFGMKREYAVRVMGRLSEEQMERLRRGVTLEDGPARFDVLEEAGGSGANRWYRAVLDEGRNREVRRMFASAGMTVSRLIRVAFGDMKLPRGLRQGRYIEVPGEEVQALLSSPTPPGEQIGD